MFTFSKHFSRLDKVFEVLITTLVVNQNKVPLSLAASSSQITATHECYAAMRNKPVSKNVFADMGFPQPEAENLKLRSELMIKIERYIQDHELTQAQAAELFGIDQPRLSKLLKGRIDLFTIDKLISMLSNVDIKVTLKFAA